MNFVSCSWEVNFLISVVVFLIIGKQNVGKIGIFTSNNGVRLIFFVVVTSAWACFNFLWVFKLQIRTYRAFFFFFRNCYSNKINIVIITVRDIWPSRYYGTLTSKKFLHDIYLFFCYFKNSKAQERLGINAHLFFKVLVCCRFRNSEAYKNLHRYFCTFWILILILFLRITYVIWYYVLTFFVFRYFLTF